MSIINRKVVEIYYNKKSTDPLGVSIKKDIMELGFNVSRVETVQLYEVLGHDLEPSLENLCGNLLVDQVTQKYMMGVGSLGKKTCAVEVWYKPGVTDVVGESVLRACADMQIHSVEKVRSGMKYVLYGIKSKADAEYVASHLLANSVIHQVKIVMGR